MRIQPTDRHVKAARAEAEAEALRDVDGLAEWLSSACYMVPAQKLQPVLRDKTAEDFTSWTIPALLALLFDAGQPAQTTMAARDALRARRLISPMVARDVEQQTDERAGEIAEQEEAGMREAA